MRATILKNGERYIAVCVRSFAGTPGGKTCMECTVGGIDEFEHEVFA